MSASTSVIERQRAREIVDGVNQARGKVLEGFRLLAEAKADLGTLFGTGYDGGYADHLWEDRISDSDLRHQAPKTDQLIATNAWRYLLRLMGLYDYMTDARQKECEAQLTRGEFPALTVENMQSTLETLTGDMGSLLIESVTEVFGWLRPQYPHGTGALKTNKKFLVGYTVIVPVLKHESRVWGLCINAYREKDILALGKVLSLLDGKGVPQYPHDLSTQLGQALKTAHAGDLLTLPYFTCRPRKNGNLAIAFTRHDLIDRLNQIGADGSLGAETTR